jgi:integrase
MYLSRVNTYAAFFILKATGLRLVEMFNLKWEDIKLIDVSFDTKGRMRKVYKFHVKETKTFRKRNSAGVRQVIAPQRLESIFDRIRRENPHHCSPSDYVLNLNGKRRKTLQKVWANVLIGASMPNRKGVAVDCTTHESGTTLDLRHLRSYYVSDMLLNREINPYILERQTGHGISTILDYYLTRQPKRTSMLQLGGWEFPQRLVQETYKM